MQLKVGQAAPDFTLPSHLGENVSLHDLRGRNVVMAFFPAAWTPVCGSQIPAYEAELDSLVELNAQVLGVSVDHVPCLQSWARALGGISYPLLSDFWPHGEISSCYGVLGRSGFSERAIFVIDGEGIIRYIDVHDIDLQPDNDELRRVLREINPQAAANYRPQLTQDESLPRGGIVIYCTPWCEDCKEARAWLAENQLHYREVDISRNRRAAAQVREWAGGNQTTPVFDIDGEIVVDWNLQRLKEVLGVN